MKLIPAFNQFLNAKPRAKLTRKKYQYRLRPFLDRYGYLEVNQITPSILFDWFDVLGETNSEATLSLNRACFRALLAYCVKLGWCRTNAADTLPRYDDRPLVVRLPRVPDVQAAWGVCRQLTRSNDATERRDAALFALAVVSGKRRGELQNLTVSAMRSALADGEDVYLCATTGKTGRSTVVFNGECADMLRRYLEVRPDTDHNQLWVVTSESHRSYGQPLGQNGLQHVRKRICKLAGIKPISFQQLRRLKGTQIAREYGLEVASQALGHKCPSVIRNFYYDPNKELAYNAIVNTTPSPTA